MSCKTKRENIEFFTDSLSAEKAGYRPCLRCHPEFSPDSMAWPGKSAIVQRALQLIAQNAMFEMDVESFASQLGVSARHLRRLFEDEIGLSPKKISDLHRLNFARKLIIETPQLDLTTVAMSSGFASLRRFNDAFIKRYHSPPRHLRKAKSLMSESGYTLHIAYRPSLSWENLLLYFRKHEIPYLENVTESTYRRLFKVGKTIGIFEVKNDEKKAQLELHVQCQDPTVLFTVTNRVRKMFDLDSDPLLISNQFASIPFLAELWEEFPGLRIAKGWDPFEIAIGTILGQVISVKQASSLMGELIRHYGEEVLNPITQEKAHLFPSPEVLAKASLKEIKTTTQRKKAINALAQAILDKKLSLEEYQDPEDFKNQLKNIEGIGNWSAEYISLRGLGNTNAFPKDDLILKRALTLNSHLDPKQLEPWRGYLAVYLWRKYAETLSRRKS